MKKKIISAALTLALVLAVCITGAFAAHGGFWRGSGTCLSGGQNFVDEDGDGVCDNWASRPMDGTGLGSGRGHHGCHN